MQNAAGLAIHVKMGGCVHMTFAHFLSIFILFYLFLIFYILCIYGRQRCRQHRTHQCHHHLHIERVPIARIRCRINIYYILVCMIIHRLDIDFTNASLIFITNPIINEKNSIEKRWLKKNRQKCIATLINRMLALLYTSLSFIIGSWKDAYTNGRKHIHCARFHINQTTEKEWKELTRKKTTCWHVNIHNFEDILTLKANKKLHTHNRTHNRYDTYNDARMKDNVNHQRIRNKLAEPLTGNAPKKSKFSILFFYRKIKERNNTIHILLREFVHH